MSFPHQPLLQKLYTSNQITAQTCSIAPKPDTSHHRTPLNSAYPSLQSPPTTPSPAGTGQNGKQSAKNTTAYRNSITPSLVVRRWGWDGDDVASVQRVAHNNPISSLQRLNRHLHYTVQTLSEFPIQLRSHSAPTHKSYPHLYTATTQHSVHMGSNVILDIAQGSKTLRTLYFRDNPHSVSPFWMVTCLPSRRFFASAPFS